MYFKAFEFNIFLNNISELWIKENNYILNRTSLFRKIHRFKLF